MGYRINHIHLKAPDPRKTADWYVKAFDFTPSSPAS
jgi:catechol-2,3-dioxygenase